jgi:hypothetical protein
VLTVNGLNVMVTVIGMKLNEFVTCLVSVNDYVACLLRVKPRN